MKTEIIASDSPVEAKPREFRPELQRVRSKRFKGKNITHKDMLEFIRTKRYAREVHSSFFLAVDLPAAYFCKCGFTGVFRSERCARCNRRIK